MPRKFVSLLAAATLTLAAGTALTPAVAHADSSFTASPEAGRPFSTDSVWNDQLEANATLDPDNTDMVNWLGNGDPWAAAIYDYGFPVYNGTSSDGTVTIDCTQPWGTCAAEGINWRAPATTTPAPGTDGHLILVDWTRNEVVDMWQASRSGSVITASWATKTSITGTGAVAADSGATGAGINAVAGVVRTYEIVAAATSWSTAIQHALSVGTSNTCNNATGGYRYPASKTDGNKTTGNCLPEGARFRLKSTVNCGTISGGYGVKATCQAFKDYGAIVRDNSGAHVGVAFENPNGGSDPYDAAGLDWDSFDLQDDGGIPLTSGNLEVLASWNATTTGSDTTAPTVPGSFTATRTNSTTVTMTWTASTDAVGVTQYNVWRGDSSFDNWTQIATVTHPNTGYVKTGLTSGVQYTWCIRAQDAAGNISGSTTCLLR